MDIGEELGDERDKVAEMVAPIALLADSARFYASVPQVDHAVFGEATDKPGDVQDAALRRVVGVPDDCFIVVRHARIVAPAGDGGIQEIHSPRGGGKRSLRWALPLGHTAGKLGAGVHAG